MFYNSHLYSLYVGSLLQLCSFCFTANVLKNIMTLRAMFVPINVTDVTQNERRFLKFFFMICVCILRSLHKIMDVFLY